MWFTVYNDLSIPGLMNFSPLFQRFSRFFRENYNHKVCKTDQKEFLNGWYVLVIVSDAMAIVGSILKMEIQAKVILKSNVQTP